MTIKLDLPADIENALIAEANAIGMTLDEFLSQMVISRTGTSEPALTAVLVPENGIPVLRTGHPLSAGVVDMVMEAVRTEREQSILGLTN